MVPRSLALVAATLTVLVAGGIAGVSQAAASCSSPFSSYLVGAWVPTGHAQEGVQADITTDPNATLCNSSSASLAWVGEVGPSCKNCIAQVGYSRFGTTPDGGQQNSPPYKENGAAGFHYFDLRKKCDNDTTCPWYMTFLPTPAPSGTNTYKVGYDTTNHRFNLWLNGSILDHTVWDPKTVWGDPTTWTLNLMGEVFNCDTDVPNVTFSNIQREGTDGIWGAPNFLALNTSTPSCARFHDAQGGDWPNSFSISDS
jgi:hypothetical protein